MSTWVKDALAAAGVSYRGLADWLHPVYPKASAPAIAAACNPADTGVTFTGTAAKIIAVLTGHRYEYRRGFQKPKLRRLTRLVRPLVTAPSMTLWFMRCAGISSRAK